ncbi:MAG: heparinase II/III family protein, partial [Pyrinomonadaceae bacterium]
VPIERQEKWHYFADHDVVYWRSSWADDATAFAFKAGPPEGHATKALLEAMPDWRLSSGHAHPDAGSFIIWSHGRYLTGDAGYAGVPLTEHHNTVVIGGRGQGKEGGGHDVFADVPYDRLDRIRIDGLTVDAKHLTLIADLAQAYEPEVGVTKFQRKFEFSAPGSWTITDDIALSRPQVVTSYLHADETIVKRSESLFEFGAGQPVLSASVSSTSPFAAKIEKNIVVAPGPPGAVDKGQAEDRGLRLAISTVKPVDRAGFSLRLSLK